MLSHVHMVIFMLPHVQFEFFAHVFFFFLVSLLFLSDRSPFMRSCLRACFCLYPFPPPPPPPRGFRALLTHECASNRLYLGCCGYCCCCCRCWCGHGRGGWLRFGHRCSRWDGWLVGWLVGWFMGCRGVWAGRGCGCGRGRGSQLSQTEESLRRERVFINKINLVSERAVRAEQQRWIKQ